MSDATAIRQNTKRQRPAALQVEDLYVAARLMWRLDPSNPRSTGSEDRDFREYFGCNVLNALIIWNLLRNLDFLPESGSHHHFLWSLCYMKQYPKTRAMCSICGGIDPATMRKWVWAYIAAIACLEEHVVSYFLALYYCFFCQAASLTSLLFVSYRSYGKTD